MTTARTGHRLRAMLVWGVWFAVVARGQTIDDARLDRWVWELGGRAALRAAPLVTITAEVEMESAPGKLTPLVSYATPGGQYRVEVQRADVGLLIEAYDGKFGWRHNDQFGSGLIMPAELRERAHWDDVYLPLRYKELFVGVGSLPDETWEGTLFRVLQMTPREGPPEQWYFDFKTGLLHARVRKATSESSGFVIVLTDYRTVKDRLKLPHVVTTYSSQGRATVRRSKITLSPAGRPDRFTPGAEIRTRAVKVGEVLDRHLAAIGGEEAAARLRSRVSVFKIENPGTGVVQDVRISQLSPHFMLIESESPGLGRALQGFDGVTGWAYSDIEGYHVLKGGELASVLNTASLRSETFLRARAHFGKVLPPVERPGQAPLRRLELASYAGRLGIYDFDATTGLMVRAEGSLATGAQGQFEALTEFADFRAVDGIVMPFKVTTTNPAVTTITTLLSVEHDVELAPAIFAPRKEGTVP